MFFRSLVSPWGKKRSGHIFQSRLCHHLSVSPRGTTAIPLSTQDDDCLRKLNHNDWLAPNEVLKIIKAMKDPNLVTTVLDGYAKRKDYKPNEALYTSVINKLARAKMFDAIEDIMSRIKTKRSCRLSDEFFYGVIKIYGHEAGRIGKAIQTLFEMPEYNCWPTVKTFNFVLNLVVSAKLFDFVHEVYLGASKLGIEVDACCLNILVKGLCESGNVDAACNLLDEFPKQRCRPNVKTFSTLMHGFCERGRVDEALGLLERMDREGVFPDTITYNVLLSGLRKQGRVEEGMGLMEKMKLKGCYPNEATYQEVLYSLLDSEEFAEAKKFMAHMILKGAKPGFRSYRLIIHGLCEEKLVDHVDWVLKQMIQQGFIPKTGMWRKIIHCILSGSCSADSSSFLKIVENRLPCDEQVDMEINVTKIIVLE